MVEKLEQLTYQKRLLSEKQIQIILLICRDNLNYSEIADKLGNTKAAIRKYAEIIRKKFESNLEIYIKQLSNIPNFDISQLWKHSKNYNLIKEKINSKLRKE